MSFFGDNINSFVNIDNKGQHILVLCEGPTQALDNTTLTEEVKFPTNFAQSRKRFVLSLHCNGSNILLQKTYQFKARDSKIKDYALCLGNI